MPDWLTLDERTDVSASISEVRRQVDRVRIDTYAWKWATIALASAVNSALVCNLSGTTNIGALSNKNMKLAIAELEDGSEKDLPEPHLAPPMELLRRASSSDYERPERAGKLLPLTLAAKASFKKLITFRNEFLHFKPLSWSIETSGFPEIFIDCLAIIELILDDGWSFRHADDCELDQLLSDLVALRTGLKSLSTLQP